MRELLYGSAGELLGAVFYAVVASALAVLGALTEQASLQNLAAGHQTLGLWEAAVGALLIYAGVSVAYRIALPRLRGAGSAA
jgi:uncharacterized BrkB/YihY/UPF0761 family membrane protein